MGKVANLSAPDFNRGVSDAYTLKPLRRLVSKVGGDASTWMSRSKMDGKPCSGVVTRNDKKTPRKSQ